MLLLLMGTWLVVAPPLFGQTPGQQQDVLTNVRQIRDLTVDQAAQRRPVHLYGVVTVLSGWKSSFFLQDPTFGISVDRMETSPNLEPGDMVELRGVSSAGLFAPIVLSSSVTVLAHHKLPPAPEYSAEELSQGHLDAQWITVKGLVRSAVVTPRWGRNFLALKIDMGSNNLITASVYDYKLDNVAALVGSRVSVRGVCATTFNHRRQFIGLRLFVADLGEVHVDLPAPHAPFDAPTKPLGRLLQFDPRMPNASALKVQGVVTYLKQGDGFYIQDGNEGAYIQSSQPDLPPIGTRLEAVGYPSVSHYSPELEDALFRVIGPSSPPQPVAEAASQMIVNTDGFTFAPHDSVLVRMHARLVEKLSRADEDVLLLEDHSTIFTAHVLRSGNALNSIATGSIVSLVGVCVVRMDDAHEIRSFRLLLRTPADITVIKAAPWWTPKRAVKAIAILGALMLGYFGVVELNRRQRRLRELAVTDPLTGLYNRRGFLLLAQQLWHSALRRHVSFLLFYIDVNHFKEINDTFGHKEGDLALQVVSDVLKDTFRKADIIGRLGGDEFAVAAIDASEHSIGILKSRILTALEQHPHKSRRRYELTLSIGVLTCDSSLGHVPIEDLLTRADELMYHQKRSRMSSDLHSPALPGFETLSVTSK